MRRIVLALLGLAALMAIAAAHIRLKTTSLAPLFWQVPNNVSVVINKDGSDNLAEGAHFPALRNGMDTWNDASGSVFSFVEDTTFAQQKRTDWEETDIHLLLFDEDNSSGFFPFGSGTVAVTPVLFNSTSGKILDADILFNGRGFDFTTSGQFGRFDVQDVATHEMGHFLGLDHTGAGGGTMYPFVAPGLVLQRSLALDDRAGVRDAYPSAQHARISGTVKRGGGSSVSSAFVVARDVNGYTAGSALADASGVFSLEGLDPGDYTLYATPLDSPVSSANLQALYTVETDFASTVGGMITAAAGANAFGDLVVDPDVTLGLGSGADDLPVRAIQGVPTNLVTLGGAGLLGAALTSSSPSVSILVNSTTSGTIRFSATAQGGAAPGHVDLIVTNGAETSILPAAIEITPPDPGVSTVAPGAGAEPGGTAVTITGSGFRAGARVVIGKRVYVDGGLATVVNSGTINLTTVNTVPGTYDVVVIDPTGVEGRKVGAFAFVPVPSIDSVFPQGGAAVGGTQVTIRGQDFVSGVTVRIDGVTQTNVVREDASTLRVMTNSGTPGGPYTLEVENVGGTVATSAFTYASAPDPVLTSVSPATGDTDGGDRITLTGTGFVSGMVVRFGTDPDTGLGGKSGTNVTAKSSSTLKVTTPERKKGKVNVLVQNPVTGQAIVLTAAFKFEEQDSGGGGGGCYTSGGPVSWNGRDALAGAWWLLAALAFTALRRPRREPTPA